MNLKNLNPSNPTPSNPNPPEPDPAEQLARSPSGSSENRADLLLLLAVVLPPAALNSLGEVIAERVVNTRFGEVGPLALRLLPSGERVWVQPYSGLPSRTDPRATILAAKKLGVQRVLAWDMGIAVNPMLERGQPMVVVDYIDFTRHQPNTFFAEEGVPIIPQDPPVCPHMTAALFSALSEEMTLPGGVYLGVDGPRRETGAEARMFRRWGADAAGQNLVPEIALAAEMELCFAGLVTMDQMSTDRQQSPNQGELRQGLGQVLNALPRFVQMLSGPITCPCQRRLGPDSQGGMLAAEWMQE